jgi:hypothetical protein
LPIVRRAGLAAKSATGHAAASRPIQKCLRAIIENDSIGRARLPRKMKCRAEYIRRMPTHGTISDIQLNERHFWACMDFSLGYISL